MIRQANKYDMEAIVRMLKAFRDKAPTQFLRDSATKNTLRKCLTTSLLALGLSWLLLRKMKQWAW